MKRFIVPLIIALLLVSTILTSCGGDTTTTSTTKTTSTSSTTPGSTTTTTTSTTGTTATSTTTATTAMPGEYGGTLRILYPYTIASIPGWPSDSTNAQRGSAAWTIFEPMIKQDKSGNPIPWLATDWEWGENKADITFNLRDDVTFHDGTKFTADAVKLEGDLCIEAKLANAVDWDRWEVINDYTIKLYLKQYKTDFWANVTGINMCFFSPTAYEQNGKEWMMEHPIGTGPFKYLSFEKDVALKVVRNDNYWKAGLPYLDEIDHIITKDQNTRRMALMSGEGDVSFNEQAKFLFDMKELGYDVRSAYGGTDFIMFNTMNADSIYNDARIRQAIEYALDKETMAETLGYGYYIANNQMPPPDNPSHNNDLPSREYNTDKAKQLLADAGYPDGFAATMITIGASTTAQVIQESLKAVGINVEFESVDNAKFWDYMRNGWGNSMVYVGYAVGINYPAWLKQYFPPTSTLDVSVKLPDEMVEKISPALAEQDETKAKELSDELIQLTWDDAILVPIYSNSLGDVISPKVHDTGMFDFVDFSIWSPEATWMEQ